MIRLDADNNFRILIVTSNLDYSHLLNSDRKHRYQIQRCESVSEALATYQQEPSGCILLDWETTPIDKELLSQINIALVPVVILFETQNADIVRQNTEDCLAKESLTPELISFAIGQAIAKAALKQKLAEAEYKLHKYELTALEKPQPSKDFLLSIHNLLSRQLQKELRDRQANENLLKIQNAILEKIAKGDELSEILDMLVLEIETQLSNALCTILICDQYGKLNHVSAPNLPKTFANQCNGIPIGEGVGSCGTAAFRKKPVIVPDIATDYLWNNYKEIPLDNGLLACWSFPIINSEELVLGTFGVYHREIYTPTTQELEVVSLAANIAGIALERDRATQELNLLNQELYLLNQELEMWVEQRTIALQASESKSRAILSLIPDLMFEVSVDGIHIEFVNGKRELSVVPPDIELVGKSMAELLPEELFKRQSHYLREAIETGELQVYEHQVQVNGHLQDEEVRVIKSSKNHALFMVRNISDRKSAEEALQKSELKLRKLTENIPVVLYQFLRKPDGSVSFPFMSQGSYQLFGLSPEAIQLKASLVFDLVHPQDLSCLNESIQLSAQTLEAWKWEGRIYTSTGKVKWISGISQPELTANGEILWHGLLKDVSDRKMAELKLARSQEELNYHIEHSPLATIRWDREFRVEYWSKQAEKIFGWKTEEVLGKNIYECQLIFEEDIPYVQQVAEQLMKGLPQTCQNRNYRKDGTIIHCEWYNSVLMDENGNLTSMLSLTQDITKRKQIEIEIAQSREALSQTAATLKQQMERQHFITHITQQIHQSLNIEKILTTAVNEIKRLLNGDRVVVFQFVDGVTKVVKEMVNPEYLSIINMDIADNYFTIESINYHLNLNLDLALYSSDIAVKSINYHLNFNREPTPRNLEITSNEYSEKFVKQASIKSQIVIPIIQYTDSGKPQEGNHTDYQKNDQLWGLLIVHSCSQYRHWQHEEVDLLKQIANQLAIAIQQASLYEQVQSELYNRQQFERQLMNELNQKKVLLKEIHHRVKNNLQVMSSILYLQFRNAPSEIKILTEEYQNRILAMSLIHEQLYRSDDLAHIDFYDYISNLTANLFECYGISLELINIEIEVEDICLSLDQSIPLGLIINELVSNALKYAFPKKHGQIRISLIHETDQIILTISDDGVGLPEDFDLENADGLGMQLIISLTEQLEGNLSYDGKNGLTIKISFPNLS